MKNIELTKEHKSKLLEMCRTLFPEYDFGLDKWKQPFVSLGLKTKDLYEEHIHWFEFCICWLATSIYNKRKINHFSILEYRGFLCQSVDHPVDFLYEEFKKLK